MNASTSTISTPRPGDQALHPAVTKIWKRMLDATYPDAASGSPPEIDRWHRAYVEAGRGRRTNRPFRHVGRRPSCTSGPTGLAEHRKRFIEDLPVPGGGRQAIPAFERAVRTVLETGGAFFGTFTNPQADGRLIRTGT